MVSPSAPPRRSVRVWDIVVTVILLLLLAGLALIMSAFGFYLAMAPDSCGTRGCDTDLIAAGMLTAVLLPWAFLLVALIVSIVLLVRRRLAFWVALAAAPLVVASLFIGAIIAGEGVPS